MANMPGFGNAPTLQGQLSTLTGRVLQYCSLGSQGLNDEQWHDTAGGKTNSPAFDIFHVVRTIDNIVHFAFDRDTPVWLAGNYHERWNLPRVDQGTGMDPAIAYALRFPMPEEFDEYIKAVQDAVVSRIAGQSDEYLQTFLNIRPWGSLSRAEAIMHGLIGHGNGHLGRISYLRDMWGLKGLGY